MISPNDGFDGLDVPGLRPARLDAFDALTASLQILPHGVGLLILTPLLLLVFERHINVLLNIK